MPHEALFQSALETKGSLGTISTQSGDKCLALTSYLPWNDVGIASLRRLSVACPYQDMEALIYSNVHTRNATEEELNVVAHSLPYAMQRCS